VRCHSCGLEICKALPLGGHPDSENETRRTIIVGVRNNSFADPQHPRVDLDRWTRRPGIDYHNDDSAYYGQPIERIQRNGSWTIIHPTIAIAR
jgi:hypothetical protein